MTSDNSQEGADPIPPLLGSPQGHTFESWWEQPGSIYAAAVEAAGGQCWTQELEERRALWERRYTRPAPPANLKPIESIKSYQRGSSMEVEHPDDELANVAKLEIAGVIYHLAEVERFTDELAM